MKNFLTGFLVAGALLLSMNVVLACDNNCSCNEIKNVHVMSKNVIKIAIADVKTGENVLVKKNVTAKRMIVIKMTAIASKNATKIVIADVKMIKNALAKKKVV